jgi:hypothetical protein
VPFAVLRASALVTIEADAMLLKVASKLDVEQWQRGAKGEIAGTSALAPQKRTSLVL